MMDGKLLFCVLSAIILAVVTAQDITACSSPDAQAGRIFIRGVREDKTIGSVLVHLNFPGTDTEIQLSQSGSSEYFSFDPNSRNFTVAKSLMNQVGENLVIECRLLAWAQSVNIQVIVEIMDLNNNAPEFTGLPYTANISELSPVGTTVFSDIAATDADQSNNYITYQIQSGQFSDCFAIPAPAQGQVVLTKMLDYEQIQMVTLSIIATDNHPAVSVGEPPVDLPQPVNTATATLSVYIRDGDDQNPAFSQHLYTGTIVETDVTGTVVDVGIIASDPDVAVQSPLTYSIVQDAQQPGDGQYFNIASATGVLTLARDGMLRGLTFSFLVQVIKTNNPDRYSQALVKITVQAANENPPYFIQEVYNITLVENVPVGSNVVTVTAFDNDQVTVNLGVPINNDNSEGTVLVYSFVDEVTDFSLHSHTGSITTTNLLSFERIQTYSLRVQVTDGTHTDQAVVNVKLMNTNNHNPLFEEIVYNFGGERELGYRLGSVRATDEDVGSTLKYSFSVPQLLFMINRDSGEIEVVASTPEELDKREYTLMVLASDDGSPPRIGTTQVNVLFEPILTPAAVTESSSNMVVVIVLGVLVALLLALVIVLIILLYRNMSITPSCASTHTVPFTPTSASCITSQASQEHTGVKLLSYITSDMPQYHRQAAETKNKKCVRSRSFEQSIDFSRKDYTSYLDPQGLAYKPNTGTKHHLDLYNNVGSMDRTTVAENPFSAVEPATTEPEVYDDGIYAYTSSATDVKYPTDSNGHVRIPAPSLYARPQKQRTIPVLGGTMNSSSSDQQQHQMGGSNSSYLHRPNSQYSSTNTNQGMGSYERQLPSTSHAEYETEIHPAYDEDDSITRYKQHQQLQQQQHYEENVEEESPRSSINSDDHYNADLTSFKVGSTTRLVGGPPLVKSKSRSISNKGSGNISFVDAVDVSPQASLYSSMTSQRSDGGMNTIQSDDSRPGITVYY